jgi:hypothetical protein
MMKMKHFLAIVFLLVSAAAAFANPIDPDIFFSGGFGGLHGSGFIALIAEALVVAGLLAWREFRFSRVFYGWLPVTFVTYCFMTGGIGLFLGLYEGFALRFWLTVLMFEIIVILVEAWVILRMSESMFFRDDRNPLPYRAALLVSIAGNIISFGLGFLGFWIF